VVQAHEGRIGRLVANEDGTLLASAGDDGRVLLWAAGAETPLARPLDVDFRNDWVPAVDVSPDGSKIVFTGSHDAGETIVLNQWHVDDGRVDTAFPKRTRSSAELSADGTRVAAGTKDGRIVIWDTISGNLIAEHQTADDSGVWALNVRSGLDGSLVAFGSERGAVRLWDGASDSPIGSELPGQGARITALAFSDDGTLLAAGTENGLVRLWDVATGEPRGSFSYSHSSFSYSVLSLAFSPDDSLLAVSGFREISLWDIEEMRLRDAPLTGHEGRILAVDFSPDGRWFASGSEEGVVLIWDVATWQPFAGRLDEASSEIDDLAFSPDSSLIAAGTEAGEIQVWQLTARFASPLSALRVADGPIRSMAFTVDGAWLVSLDPDGVVTRWSFSEESWVKRACAIANRNLSREEWEIFIGSEAIPYHTSCPDRPGPRLDSPATPHAGNGERT
jgi:WD40 repeat protein